MKLKERASNALEYGLERLRETGELNMMFHLVLRSGGVELVFVSAEITNDEDAKRALAKILRERIKKGEIEAVIMVSDTFFAQNMSAEANKLRLAFDMTIEQAAAIGLCEKREAVMVRLESPIYCLHLNQEYVRDEAAKTITLKGERVEMDSTKEDVIYSGRFSNFFPPQASEARPV